MFILENSIYAKKLIELDCPNGLITTEEDCKIMLDHLTQHNMKWLDGSYGTIVHRDFDKIFDYCDTSNNDTEKHMYNTLKESCHSSLIDHANLFKIKFKNENKFLLTSSPYKSLNNNLLYDISQCCYHVYVIHPNILDYYAFLTSKMHHPLQNLNYCITTLTPVEIYDLNKKIADITNIYNAFVPIH